MYGIIGNKIVTVYFQPIAFKYSISNNRWKDPKNFRDRQINLLIEKMKMLLLRKNRMVIPIDIEIFG